MADLKKIIVDVFDVGAGLRPYGARAAPGMKGSWEAQPLFPNRRRFGRVGGFSVKSLGGFW